MLQSFIVEKQCELGKGCTFNQWLRDQGFETQEEFPFTAIQFFKCFLFNDRGS